MTKFKTVLTLDMLLSTAFIVAIFLAFFVYLLDQSRGGPVTETIGRIQSFSTNKHANVTAFVLLENNNLVLANNVSGTAIRPNEIAHIRIYRSVIFGRYSYEIYKTQQSAMPNKNN